MVRGIAVLALCAGIGVLGAFRRAPAQDVRTTVSGTVYDSVRQRHVDSAIVQMLRADRQSRLTTVADHEGRFRFDSVPRGDYVLGVLHRDLDALGLPDPMVHVRVRDAQPIHADVGLPSAATLVRMVCGVPADSGGLWYGSTRSAVDGSVLPGVIVQSQWSRIRLIGRSIRRDVPQMTGPSDDQGTFRHCFLPTEEMILARAWRDADSSGVLTFTMPQDGLLRRDIYIAPVQVGETRVPADSGTTDSVAVPVRVGTGRLVGRVTNAGDPLAGARLRFLESGAEAITNDKGYFGFEGLPLGTHAIDARALGYLSAVRSVDVLHDVVTNITIELPDRQSFLDTVRVMSRAPAVTYHDQEFTQRRRVGIGRFWDEDDIEKARALFVSDLFRLTPGVRILPRGQMHFQSIGGLYCVPVVFLDGQRLAGMGNVPIDAMVNVEDIRAIEAYTRGSQVPAQFKTLDGCGSIVIWTGARRRRQP